MPPSLGFLDTVTAKYSKWSRVISHIAHFLTSAPNPNPKRFEKKGRVCGIKVEEIEDGMERDMRILDLLVDEIAKGKKLEKVFLEE